MRTPSTGWGSELTVDTESLAGAESLPDAEQLAGVEQPVREEQPDPTTPEPAARPPSGAASPPWRRAVRPMLAASAGYLAVSVLLWWNVWSSDPTTTTTCACGDSALFLWFLEWPAYAIAHGHNVLYSTSLFHPQGINLLSNTSELAVGVVLAPVTWLFGPVATLNVAVTLSPVLSGLAMFWLLRRWVAWLPGAFAGGLLYGFSPYVIGGLADAHLMVGLLVVPPLVVACLDELLVRQRRRPAGVGVALGLLLALQFFVGTEMLVLMAVMAAAAVIVVAAYAAVAYRAELRRRVGHAVQGVGWSIGTATVLLAYPAWYALAGPAHLSGLVWPQTGRALDGSTLTNLVTPAYMPATFVNAFHVLGGYQGGGQVQEYFGIGLLAVLAAGLLLWRGDRRLWLFGSLGAVSVALSLGRSYGEWVPWALVKSVPLLENVIQDRFIELTYLCAAVMLAVTADRFHGAVASRAAGRGTAGRRAERGTPPGARLRAAPPWLRRLAAPVVATAVVLVALVPIGTTYAASTPLTVQHAFVPRWFTEVAPHLPGGQVVLAYPAPFSGVQSAMAWQAIDGMHFAMAGGGSPEGIAARAGKERAGFVVLQGASLSLGPPPPATPANVRAVRQALAAWGVTTVVVPDQPDLPGYDQGNKPAYAVGLFTAALGQRPRYQADAWVWPEAKTPAPQVAIGRAAFDTCARSSAIDAQSHMAIPDCVLAHR